MAVPMMISSWGLMTVFRIDGPRRAEAAFVVCDQDFRKQKRK